ncbi:MAG: hydrogenase maturation nickel metallochaperone HypA [Nitrospirae bacterium]|nr:MAG: hydrogenase maturation nickel metallochaperone HypA [Nitrospirota bacterium]
MHEFHLLAKLVKLVEARLEEECPGARPVTVRLQVRIGSHLHDHDAASLQASFALAAQGTAMEQARLEVFPVATLARCRACGAQHEWDGATLTCPTCETPTLEIPDGPEVVVVGIEVAE